LVALASIPAFFNIQSNTSFEPDKAALIRSLAAVVALIALLEALKNRNSGNRLRWSQIDGIWKMAAGVIVATAASTLFGVDPITALWGNYERGMGLLALLAGVAFMWAAAAATKAGWLWAVVDALLIGAAAPAFYGLMQVLGHDPVRSGTVSFALGQRAAGSLGNPLFLADFLLLAVILGLARLRVGPGLGRGSRLGLGFYLLLLAAALFATGSRSALFGLLAAIVIFFLAWGQRQGRRTIQMAGALVLLLGLLLLLVAWATPAALPPRLGDLFASGGTGGQRLLIWQAVLDLLADRPRLLISGLGPDSLALALAPYTPAALAHFEIDWAFRIPDRAHTFVLDLLGQVGLPGLAMWTIFWAGLGARLLPRPSPWRQSWLPLAMQIAGAGLLAGLAAALAGWRAAPLGFTAGLLVGLALALWPLPAHRDPAPSLKPYLLAALAGHWLLLGFSFPTHASDLLIWTLAGLVAAGDGAHPPKPVAGAASGLPFHLAGVAAAGIGFSLSAALPRSLLLWLAALLLLYLVAFIVAARPKPGRDLAAFLLSLVAILPALILNRFSGLPAWLAYTWLLAWLAAQVVLLLEPSRRRPALALCAAALALAVPLNLPVYGDIAFKSALLRPGPDFTADRRAYMRRAFALSPNDHVLAAGIAPTENALLAPDSSLTDPQAQEVARLYQAAIASQPLAPEALAAYADWLRQRSAADPGWTSQARTRFEQLLALSPNDIEARNRLALLRAAGGDDAGALADLQSLLSLDPLYGPTYLHLATISRQAGDVAAARRWLELGRQRVPWWDELPRALAALDQP
jgi:O-antigen ligase/tetratricopeptide (TPR) repeat protein